MDSIHITWRPDWKNVRKRINNDTLIYFYVPLNGELYTNKNKHLRPIQTLNTEKYLIISSTKTGIIFKLASYTSNSNNKVKSTALSSKPTSRNYINHTIPFNTFSETLSIKNLKSLKTKYYIYNNGVVIKSDNHARITGNGGIAVNGQICTYYLICYWINNFPEYCGNNDFYGEVTTPVSDVNSIEECYTPPVGNYVSPTAGSPCQPDWTFGGSTIESNCYYVPDDPPPPPPDPNDPDPNIVNTPDPPDPCAQKKTVDFRSKLPIISTENSEILKQTTDSGIEYGTEQNLSSLNGGYIETNVRRGQTASFMPNFTWDDLNGYTIGTSHGHPGGSAPSPADAIWAFGNLYNPALSAAPASDQEFYMANVMVTTITETATYVITVKDWSALASLYAKYYADPDAANNNFIDIAQENNASAEYALLSIYGSAIILYKAPANSNVFVPLTIDSNNNVNPLPCP